MAIIMDRVYGGKFYDAYALDYVSKADAGRIGVWIAERKKKEDDLAWDIATKKNTTTTARAYIHPKQHEHLPEQMMLVEGTELPEFIHESAVGPMVNTRMKDVIESVEPGGDGQQFIPVQIVLPDGSPYNDAYFVWDVYRKVDAVDPSCEGVKNVVAGTPNGNHLWTFSQGPRSRDRLAVRKDMIGGMAVWKDFRFRPQYNFISDAMHAAFQGAGVKDYESYSNSEWDEV